MNAALDKLFELSAKVTAWDLRKAQCLTAETIPPDAVENARKLEDAVTETSGDMRGCLPDTAQQWIRGGGKELDAARDALAITRQRSCLGMINDITLQSAYVVAEAILAERETLAGLFAGD